MLDGTITQEQYEALHEVLQAEYTKKGDNYELQASGMKPESAFSDMRDAIGKERSERREIEKQLEAKNKEYTDLASQRDELQARIDTGTGGDDNFEERAEKRFEPQRTRLEKQVADLTEKVNEVTQQNQELVGAQHSSKVRDEIATVLTDMKVAPSVIKDAQDIGANNFEFDPATGTVVGKDGSTVQEWAEASKETRPHWFGTTVGGGAQGGSASNTVGNPWSQENWSRENQATVVKEKGMQEATRLAKAAGLTSMAATHKEIATKPA